MAWTYFQVSEVYHWRSDRLGLERLRIVRGINTRKRYCYRECGMGLLIKPQSGMTLQPLEALCFRELTLFREASHVRTFPLRDIKKVWEASEADYFSKSPDWLLSADLVSFSWKTSQQSLFSDWTESCWNSIHSGMTVGGLLYQPQKLEPAILENDGSYLPTPTASEYGKNQSRDKHGNPSGKARESLTQLARYGMLPGSPQGRLHPQWKEQAMGFPSEWTAIGALETQWYQRQQQKPSQNYSPLEMGAE